MYVLFMVLNDRDYLDEVLSRFVKLGVSGTILESQGMAHAIVEGNYESIPLFGSLKSLLTDTHPYSNTIFSVIKGQEKVDEVVASIQELFSDVHRKDLGFIFSIPVVNIYPIKQK
jgi:nitrogen regulatory protein PII